MLYFRDLSGKRLNVICYRDRIRDGRREIEHSIVIAMDEIPKLDLKEG